MRIKFRIRWAAYVAIAALIVGIALLGFYFSGNQTYATYTITEERKQDDTLSYAYLAFAGNVLQYGEDGAMLLDRNEGTVWEKDFDMTSPKAVVSEAYGAIYDQNGMSIVVFGEEKAYPLFKTDMQIVKADVSNTGTVAAIMDDGSNTWIKYYQKDGKCISAILTKIDQLGYPMDVAVSPNGEILAVSYLGYKDGIQTSRVYFYNFASTGDNQEDNLVGQFEYTDALIPDIEYIDNKTAVAFEDDGFIIYGGTQRLEKKAFKGVSGNIVSVFHNEKYIGVILETNSEKQPFTMKVYDLKGEERLSQGISFSYDSVEMIDDQISFYLRENLCVYNLRGTKRFEGSYDVEPQQFFAIDAKRYVTVTDDGIHWITLKYKNKK